MFVRLCLSKYYICSILLVFTWLILSLSPCCKRLFLVHKNLYIIYSIVLTSIGYCQLVGVKFIVNIIGNVLNWISGCYKPHPGVRVAMLVLVVKHERSPKKKKKDTLPIWVYCSKETCKR